MLRLRSLLFVFICSVSSLASAKGFGLNVAAGVPFLQQVGMNYQFSDKFGVELGYNLLSITGSASATLAMPELILKYHPFSGSFFIGAGLGQETLNVSAKDSLTSLEAKIDVTANTSVVKMGWMWGLANGGFWFGMDASYISPSGATETITAPGLATTDQAHIDAQDSAKKFGETAYTNITFARFGWLF